MSSENWPSPRKGNLEELSIVGHETEKIICKCINNSELVTVVICSKPVCHSCCLEILPLDGVCYFLVSIEHNTSDIWIPHLG